MLHQIRHFFTKPQRKSEFIARTPVVCKTEWFGIVDASRVSETYEPRPVQMGARRLERVPRRGEFAAIPRERSVEPIRPRVYSAPPSESNQSPVDTTRYRVSHRQLVIEIEIVTDESRADRDNIQLYNATTVLQDTVTR